MKYKKIFTGIMIVHSILLGNISDIQADPQHSESKEEVPLGHARHPEHDLKGLKVSGDFTGIAQGVKNSDSNIPNKGDFSYSADIFLEFPIANQEDSFVSFHLDMGQGDGISDTTTPTFFSPNADLEFDEENTKIVEAYFEKKIAIKYLTLTFGKLDPSAYFDTNALANNETAQFLSSQFVNNPAIELPGYTFGVRATYSPVELIDLSLGLFDSEGDFKDVFDRNFVAGEITVKPNILGKQGNYRLTLWNNGKAHPELKDAAKNDSNAGFGISIDQGLTDQIAGFVRYGKQKQSVSTFDSAFSLGLQLSGSVIGREKDELALAYGQIIPSDDSGLKSNESQIEVYYRVNVNDSFNISPDFQWVSNPSGDSTKKSFIVYGLRAQVDF